MSWVVYEDKETGERGIVTRAARESFVNTCLRFGHTVPTKILKSFKTYAEALKYKNGLDDADKLLTNLKT